MKTSKGLLSLKNFMRTACIFVLFLLLAGSLSGCFALPVEEEYMPESFFSLPDPPPWRTTEVARGDVELFSTISATHQPAREEIIRWPELGLLITGIYVNVGDEVKEGDIIASLDRTSAMEVIERAEREESRLLLRIAQLNEQYAHALWMAEVSGNPVDDVSYINQRRDMLQDLAMLRDELDYYRRVLESRLVRATMDGIVTQAMAFTERTWSSANHTVAVITDQQLSIFVISVREAEVLQVGERFEMDVGGNLVWAEVVDPEEYGIVRPPTTWAEAILIVEGEGAFSSRAIGRIHAVFAAAHDVLYVPNRAVHWVDGQHIIYVLEDGIRRLRQVEIGLEGTQYTEIVSGLALGEIVVVI